VLVETIPAWSVPINVRWKESVTDARRVELERRFRLQDGRHAEGTTWTYQLADPTPINIRALVEHDGVDDTANLNRVRFRPSLWWDRTRVIVVWSAAGGALGAVVVLLLPAARGVARVPVTLAPDALLLLVAAAPAVLIVAMAAFVLMAVAGYEPLWSPPPAVTLPQAALNGDVVMVSRLLDEGSDPNTVGAVRVAGRETVFTPIEAAVMSRDLQTIQLLVERGATITPSNAPRLLCLAAGAADGDVVDYLSRRAGGVAAGRCDPQ
jgi:hypothetical protein